MNEVKTICELALEDPAPPLRDGAAALAMARRSTARRNRLRVAGSGVAAAAVAGVLLTPAFAGMRAAPSADPAPRTETTAAGLAPAATTTTAPPSAHAAPVHGRQMEKILRAAVPSGPWKIDSFRGSGDKTVYSRKLRMEPGRQMLSAVSQIRVTADGRAGELMAVILYDGKPAPTRADLCARELAPSKVDAALPCEVITVNGVLIKVTREHDAERGEVIVAVRHLDGGELMVSSAQGVASYEPEGDLPPDAVNTRPSGRDVALTPLAEPLLTARQVAELAADPAMLP
ncbi:hypothetical protein [Phytohabitans houttuyneae]|uniref:Uncharacterized protein n=1 Tax=Phytohabitans houttuyneae TaxID=1076126 RepID=A0A6V8KP92_9ACTN|nr:hypothetical protein [Phytohabitans houttuyneae]GFJ85220.1 hypothetical protein Phou_094000 [Phytohabitans houttuyneae]